MTLRDERRQRNAARAEFRQVLSDGKPPTNKPLAEFGDLAGFVGEIRTAYAEGGTDHARGLFAKLQGERPDLAAVLTAAEEKPRVRWTTRELLEAEFPEPEWIVPGLLPMGLSTLAGRPKMGKSWLALQTAGAVGTGGRVLDLPVGAGRVLYVAFEDSERRLHDRLTKQHIPAAATIDFYLDWPLLNAGGLDALRTAIDGDGYRLAIVDTLTRAVGGADQLDLGEMNLTIGALQNITKDTGAAILTIDHHRKSFGMLGDPIDDILGSTGKAAIVDTAWGLYRERGKQDATLRATGRDVQDVDLAIQFDAQLCCWQLMGAAGDVRKGTLQSEILQAIRDLAAVGQAAYGKSIAEHLGRDRGNVNKELAELLRKGKIVKGDMVGHIVPIILVE